MSFPSRIFYGWVTPLVLRGYKKPLTEQDCWELPITERSATVVDQVRNYLKGYVSFNLHHFFNITLFRMTNQTSNVSYKNSTINTKILADANQTEDEHKNLVSISFI